MEGRGPLAFMYWVEMKVERMGRVKINNSMAVYISLEHRRRFFNSPWIPPYLGTLNSTQLNSTSPSKSQLT